MLLMGYAWMYVRGCDVSGQDPGPSQRRRIWISNLVRSRSAGANTDLEKQDRRSSPPRHPRRRRAFRPGGAVRATPTALGAACARRPSSTVRVTILALDATQASRHHTDEYPHRKRCPAAPDHTNAKPPPANMRAPSPSS